MATETTNDNAYVLMGYGPDHSYERWWHPMGVYTDFKAAAEAKDEATRRIPQLKLTIEKVPMNRAIPPTDQRGTIWECGFSYDAGGTWQWDPGIHAFEGDDLDDAISDPYDLYRLTTVGEVTYAYYGEAIRVLAESREHAAEVARPMVDAIVTEETGTPAIYAGRA